MNALVGTAEENGTVAKVGEYMRAGDDDPNIRVIVLTGIGRSWVDEILWTAQLSPFKRADDLVPLESQRLREATVERLGAALEHYEATIELPIPDKLPMPLLVHRHQGEPCPRCGTTLEAVHYEDYVMTYCPQCQTEGRVLKDRRLSRLLK